MGYFREYKCVKCSKTFSIYFGIGSMYPEAIRENKANALKGTFGQEWKELVKQNKHRVVDACKYLYYCEKCHSFDNEQSLHIYEPINLSELLKEQRGIKTVEEWGEDPWGYNPKKYKLVKNFIHKCPCCGEIRKEVNENDSSSLELVCPSCKQDIRLITTAFGDWD